MDSRKYYIKTDKKAFFYPRDFQKILELASPRQKFNLLLMINTGARINEVRNIIIQDLDKERKNILLRITKVRAKKGEKIPDPRTIPVSTKFFKYLKNNIKKFKFYSTPGYDDMLKNLSKKAGVRNWRDMSSHNIRKTFGCWLLALGINGYKVAQHLGHDPETLRTKYASPDIFNFEDKDRMREILGDLPSRLRS